MRVYVNVSNGFINAVVGRLCRVDTGHIRLHKIHVKLWLEFEGQDVGSELRDSFSNFMKASNIQKTGLLRNLCAGKSALGGEKKVFRKQFRLVPAEATTEQKVQLILKLCDIKQADGQSRLLHIGRISTHDTTSRLASCLHSTTYVNLCVSKRTFAFPWGKAAGA
jgi:hypothetical protein